MSIFVLIHTVKFKTSSNQRDIHVFLASQPEGQLDVIIHCSFISVYVNLYSRHVQRINPAIQNSSCHGNMSGNFENRSLLGLF